MKRALLAGQLSKSRQQQAEMGQEIAPGLTQGDAMRQSRLAADVRYGPQSWDEMAVTFVGYIIDAKADAGRAFSGPGRGPAPPIE